MSGALPLLPEPALREDEPPIPLLPPLSLAIHGYGPACRGAIPAAA